MSKAEALVKSVASDVNSIGFDVYLMKNYLAVMEEQVSKPSTFYPPSTIHNVTNPRDC